VSYNLIEREETMSRYIEYTNVPLIAQCGVHTCWYAAVQMIVSWARKEGNMPKDLDLHTPNKNGGGDIDTHIANEIMCTPSPKSKAIDLIKTTEMAKQFNLHYTPLSYKKLTPDHLWLMLRAHGPLFYAGRFHGAAESEESHAVVITGIRINTLVILDPWDTGSKEWAGFTTFFKALESDDDVPIVHYY
jgi:hypothetical protein